MKKRSSQGFIIRIQASEPVAIWVQNVRTGDISEYSSWQAFLDYLQHQTRPKTLK